MMLDPSSPGRRSSAMSGLLIFLALLILARASRVVEVYFASFLATRGPGAALGSLVAPFAAISLLFVGIWKWPRATAAAGAVISLLLVVTSGNGAAFLIAATLFGLTLLTGDWVSRLFRGREPEEGELAVSIAAGLVAWGVGLLLLGEAGLIRPLPLAVIALVIILARRRRIPQLWHLLGTAARRPPNDSRPAIESLWLAVVVAMIAAGFLGALRPDVSFDALAYHLPEIRDFAERGRVEPLAGLYPETFLWHNYETFLGVGFWAGGEQVVRLLHFGVGLAAFASAVALARRFEKRGAGALVLLALVAFSALCAQLKQTYVDLPAALFLTAAAVEIAASDQEPRRGWLGGFLFGGAIATKIFSLWGTLALLILMFTRRRGSLRQLLNFTLCAAIPLVPWLAWSQSRSGFFLSPYSDRWLRPEAYIPPRPWTDLAPSGLVRFFRLPYDRTFHVIRAMKTGDGFTGFLPLLLLPGVVGWGRRRFALFCIAALAAILPWFLLSSERLLSPSIRFLIPLYPLYAVFAALGLKRLTGDFRGLWGASAAVCLAIVSMTFPVQLFSAPSDLKFALGRLSREQVLSAHLPAYPLWKHVRAEDRVILLGEWDRFHCPARYILRAENVPGMREDPDRWVSEVRRLGITHIVHRWDQRPGTGPLLDSLGGCIEALDRLGAATLYRTLWEDESCSGSAAKDRRGSGGRPSALSKSP